MNLFGGSCHSVEAGTREAGRQGRGGWRGARREGGREGEGGRGG